MFSEYLAPSLYIFKDQCFRAKYFSFFPSNKHLILSQAFDMLERLDPNPEYWEGKRGACVGVFQMIIAGREDRLIIFIM